MDFLGDIVVLAGENSSEKTRLIKLLEDVSSLNFLSTGGSTDNPYKEYIDIEFEDMPENTEEKHSVINYSHSELPLQTPDGFPPYVINVSDENLRKDCNFARTSYEALLYITKMARYCEESVLEQFNKYFYRPLLGHNIKIDKKQKLLYYLIMFHWTN